MEQETTFWPQNFLLVLIKEDRNHNNQKKKSTLAGLQEKIACF
jgi:hypothetical protein